ncbi:stage III sporulation protein AG [Natronospora cellulosivora (SeqCode)]
MGIIDELKNIFIEQGEGGGKNSVLLRNIIILGMIGTLLLLFANVFLDSNDNNSHRSTQFIDNNEERHQVEVLSFEEQLANELQELISLIHGVGKSRVKIYAQHQSSYEYEYNTNLLNKITNEVDQSGGQREILEDNQDRQLVVLRDSTGSERAVVRRKTLPEITGVFIVAQGAENSQIKYDITRAVSNLLDIPVHRISVLPYERR